jgi:3-dehydroquinate dehydratase-2
MATNKRVLLLNGPNLNMLGVREPSVYGSATLVELVDELTEQASLQGVVLEHVQSNSEAVLIESIHAAFQNVDYIIINPAAFTHTSIAIRDALLTVNIPFIEVHISNIHAREEFRHYSYLSDVAQGVICGLGTDGYRFALSKAIGEIIKE